MPEQIPVFQNISSKFNQEIIIDDRVLEINIAWNSRAEAWYMTITDEDDVTPGIKLVPRWLLLRQYRSYLPNVDGDFIVAKQDVSLGDDITYENLNQGYNLLYLTPEESEQWEDFYGLG